MIDTLMKLAILIVGFILLIKGADFFVDGSSSVAKRLKVPSMIIGLTIVAMGTSLPECAVSVTASMSNNNALAVSNVVGSNLFNLMAVCGACTLFVPLAVSTDTLKKELLPIATVITPNIPEAEILCGMEIHTEEDMVAAAKAIYEDLGCAVLLKGGHNINDANDLLYTKEEVSWFKGKRINNPNTHGTGCTLSSAIAANLAKGFDLKISVQRAKDYISRALADMLDLGAGSGPMNHAFDLKDEWKEEA